MTDNINNATILVADDDHSVTELFCAILKRAGYKVVGTTNGERVVELATTHKPDTILLDVIFPEVNGIDVCKLLKENEELAPIPVLLITGLSDRKNRLDGIKAGANDYLIKPLDREEVLLRVRNAVRMKQLYDESQQNYARIKEQEELRDSLVHMVVHDLRVPMTVVEGALQFVEMTCDFSEDDPKYKMLKSGIKAATSLNEMVASILDISKLEAGTLPVEITSVNINSLLNDVSSFLNKSDDVSQVDIIKTDDSLYARCDPSITRRILLNIVINALRYNPQDEKIVISTSAENNFVKLEIKDRGPGVPEEHRERIFSKFGQVKSEVNDKMRTMGLGLAFCKLATEAQNGTIGVTDNEGGGAIFWIALPVAE